MVRRQDAEPVESRAGIERIVGRLGERGGGGMRWIRNWVGDAGVDFVAFDAMRNDGVAAKLRHGSAQGSDGTELDDGQAGAVLPIGGGLRAGARRDPRTRWERFVGR